MPNADGYRKSIRQKARLNAVLLDDLRSAYFETSCRFFLKRRHWETMDREEQLAMLDALHANLVAVIMSRGLNPIMLDIHEDFHHFAELVADDNSSWAGFEEDFEKWAEELSDQETP